MALMEDTLFDRRADSVLRTVVLPGYKHNITPQVFADFLLLQFTIGELLMRHDRICFSVYGENLLAPALIKAFGVDGVLSLLEQKAIAFALQSSIITHLVSDVPGVLPLQQGRMNSPSHSDPAASVADGLGRMVGKPGGDTLRRLQQALADAYLPTDLDLAPAAVSLAHSGYGLGRFSGLGLPPNKELVELDKAERALLAGFATELRDLAFLSHFKMETLDELVITRVCDDSLAKLTEARKLARAEAHLFQIENIPSFAQLLVSGMLPIADIPTMRQNSHASKFRRWLRNATESADAADLSRQYLDAVARPKGLFNSTTGKIGKTLGVSALSATAGALVAGPVGAAVGGTIGAAIPIVLDVSIDVIDEFVLGRVLEGWSPRNYFDKVVRPAVKKPTSQPASTG